MISLELQDAPQPNVVVARSADTPTGAWARLEEAVARGVMGGDHHQMIVRLEVVLANLEVLRDIQRMFRAEVTLGPAISARLRLLADDRVQRTAALDRVPEPDTAIAQRLHEAGFRRSLKAFQLRNLGRLLALPHGADFSVPGAGKTSVALASFALLRAAGRVDRMLVVAPLTAFAAWKDDAEACFSRSPKVAAHLGPECALSASADILLTNYHRLCSDYIRLQEWTASARTHIVLDEAHRMKRGASGKHGRAALDLAYSGVRRDILTGTPTPQGPHDLVAMIEFLYPGQANQILPSCAIEDRVDYPPSALAATNEAIARYFVRTRKSDLGLPPTQIELRVRPMGAVQEAIYSALVGRYRSSFALDGDGRHSLRKLGKVVMYLLEAATNPLLLVAGSDTDDDMAFRHEPLDLRGDEQLRDLLSRYSDYELPWKYREVVRIVQAAAENGEKVLIWSSFVRNLRQLQRLLAEWNPAIVHGGIPPVDSASKSAVTTREEQLDRFRHDSTCSVLLANPAACGEGISLHHWCHHAVYLDRTFSAGHYLQSQDRIHRLGLPDDTQTRFTILASASSIDQVVDGRLRAKVVTLAALMDDPALVTVSLPEEYVAQDGDAPVSSAGAVMESSDLGCTIQHIAEATH